MFAYKAAKVSKLLKTPIANNPIRAKYHGDINSRRVVVTGLGLLTPIGTNVQDTWTNLINGKSGVDKITTFDTKDLPSHIAAQIRKGTGPGEFDSSKLTEGIKSSASTFIEYALAVAQEALKDSNYTPLTEEQKERTGVTFGSGIGSIEDIETTHDLIVNSGVRKVSPYFIPKILINLAAGHISIKYGFKGPSHSVTTACTTGAHSIGDAYRFIKFGDADVMLAGATEASINKLTVTGFSRAKALSTSYNDKPQEASRPFDRDRDGFVIGEGAGAVVLEELEHAKKRGAKIYAEIKGYGLSSDAFHITSPSKDGSGARRAMKNAILHSGLKLEDIDYINAHATSTPLGDQVENNAIKELFGNHAYKLAVSSTKGSIGHLLGAAGVVEAIFSILAVNQDIVPPTLNLRNAEPEFDLNYVPQTSQKRIVNAAISNSFGFGGTNASLVFTKV